MSVTTLSVNHSRVPRGLRSLVPDAWHLSFSQIVRRLFRMAVLFLSARLLGVTNFGIYALLLTVVEMVAVVSGAGYMTYLTREVAKLPDAGWPLGLKVTQVRFAYIVPAVIVAVLLLKLFRFPSILSFDATLLAFSLFPRAVSESAQGILSGHSCFGPLPWIEFVQGCVLVSLAPLLILEGFGVRGIILAEILAALAGSICAVAFVTKFLKFRSPHKYYVRTLMRSVLAFNIYPFIANVYDRIDVLLLSKLAGSFATGIYSLPYRVFATLQIIPYGLMGALLPGFSSSQVDEGSRRNCARAMSFLYQVGLLFVLLTTAFARPAVLFVLGPSYFPSIAIIKILIWAGVPMLLNWALNILLLAVRKEKVFLWTASTCTIFNVLANLLLIPKFSFYGAAIVTVLTELLLLGQNYYFVIRYLGYPVFPKNGIAITLNFIATIAGFFLLHRYVPENIAGVLACGAFAAFAVWLTFGQLRFGVALAMKL